MPTEISGSTGVNKIQDGTVVAGDLASSVALGKVLQVVSGETTTQMSTTSSSYVDTNLTVNITPTSTSSKILVTVDGACQVYDNGIDPRAFAQILRASTSFVASRYGLYIAGAGSDTNWYGTHSMSILDSPATTSQLTYKVQVKLYGGGNTTIWQPDSMRSIITVMEIAG